MVKPKLVHVGARISQDLKNRITDYCDRTGIKAQFLISEILREGLADIEEDEQDIAIARERLKNPKWVSSEEFKKRVLGSKKSS